MHATALVLLIASGACLAHYRGYEARNIVEREEPWNDRESSKDYVECPVCEDTGHWMPSNEQCPIAANNGKRYKKCELGTYINEVCGNRRDCYRGPGEQCTEKRDLDIFGQKCAPGFYCNKPLGVCTGVGYVVDTLRQYIVNPTPYGIRTSFRGKLENPFIRD